MADKNNGLFSKGKFEEMNIEFIEEGIAALEMLSDVQKRYNKPDTDTFLNELRDSIIGNLLGFEMINTSKHGFDCRDTKGNKFLEVKNVSSSSENWKATFNDTNYEKADVFKDEKVYLALGVWDNAADLLFVVYGKNKEIGKYLRLQVKSFKDGNSERSTQGISYLSLIRDYDFDIIVPDSKTKEEIYQIIIKKNHTMDSDITPNSLLNFSDL